MEQHDSSKWPCIRPLPVDGLGVAANRVKARQGGVVVWFTGRPGSGKSMTARFTAKEIHRRYPGVSIEHLDGNAEASKTCLTPSAEIGLLQSVIAHACVLALHGVVVLCSFEARYQSVRDFLADESHAYDIPLVMVHLHNVTEQDSKYEVPQNADISVSTSERKVSSCARWVVDNLRGNGYIHKSPEPSNEWPDELDDAFVPSRQQIEQMHTDNVRMQSALETILDSAGTMENLSPPDAYVFQRVASLGLKLPAPKRPAGQISIPGEVPSDVTDDNVFSYLSADDWTYNGFEWAEESED